MATFEIEDERDHHIRSLYCPVRDNSGTKRRHKGARPILLGAIRILDS